MLGSHHCYQRCDDFWQMPKGRGLSRCWCCGWTRRRWLFINQIIMIFRCQRDDDELNDDKEVESDVGRGIETRVGRVHDNMDSIGFPFFVPFCFEKCAYYQVSKVVISPLAVCPILKWCNLTPFSLFIIIIIIGPARLFHAPSPPPPASLLLFFLIQLCI